jgi:hypothetical protein
MNQVTLNKIKLFATKIENECLDLRGGVSTVPEWQNRVAALLHETHILTQIHEVRTEDQRRDANHALAAWARDIKTMDFVVDHNITLGTSGKKTIWRWVDEETEVPGIIQGMPTLRGIPRITNGVLMYVEQENGKVFLGHIDSFCRDLRDIDLNGVAITRKKSKSERNEDEFRKRCEQEYV